MSAAKLFALLYGQLLPSGQMPKWELKEFLRNWLFVKEPTGVDARNTELKEL